MILLLAFLTLDLMWFRIRAGSQHAVDIEAALKGPPVASWLRQDPAQFRTFSYLPDATVMTGDTIRFVPGAASAVWQVESTGGAFFSLALRDVKDLETSVAKLIDKHPEQVGDVAGILGAHNVKYLLTPADRRIGG